MSQQRAEVDRDDWRRFFDKLTSDFEGYEVTIEVLTSQYGDQFEAEKLPLAYMEYDDKDDVLIVAVGGRDRRYPVLRHVIEHPRQVMADTPSAEMPWAIEVVASDDGQTLVTLYRPPSLPSPPS